MVQHSTDYRVLPYSHSLEEISLKQLLTQCFNEVFEKGCCYIVLVLITLLYNQGHIWNQQNQNSVYIWMTDSQMVITVNKPTVMEEVFCLRLVHNHSASLASVLVRYLHIITNSQDKQTSLTIFLARGWKNKPTNQPQNIATFRRCYSWEQLERIRGVIINSPSFPQKAHATF